MAHSTARRASSLRAGSASKTNNSELEGTMANGKSGLVVTAHPGDFVWRAGGAIALHAGLGYRMKIVCLSYGERGESQGAWRQEGMTLEECKRQRRSEAEKAAEILGAEIEFFD